jgi:oligopeptide/dipeptide ABC transporter ATP-binding protein
MTVLALEDLTVDFRLEGGRLRAVDGLSCSLAAGETLGIVGESGSGKSVTALAIVRLLDRQARVTSGRVLFEGEDLLAKSEADMRKIRGRRISMVLQEPMTSLNPAFAIGEQVAEVYRAHLGLGHADAKRRAVEMLERVRLPRAADMYGKYPFELSGGMRQRVLIAIALALGPDVLIADEPTTALDVTIQAQILALVRDLQREMGMALIFISHDLDVVGQVCDRIAVMYAGKLMEVDDGARLLAAPLHPYTAGLLRSIPRAGQPLRAIAGVVADPMALPSGCVFHPRCERAQDRCARDVPAPRSLPGRGSARVACHFPLVDAETGA